MLQFRAGSPADPLRSGPSDQGARPAPHRSLGDGLLTAPSRGLVAEPPRSSPRGPARLSSNLDGQRTPGSPGSCMTAFNTYFTARRGGGMSDLRPLRTQRREETLNRVPAQNTADVLHNIFQSPVPKDRRISLVRCVLPLLPSHVAINRQFGRSRLSICERDRSQVPRMINRVDQLSCLGVPCLCSSLRVAGQQITCFLI